MMLGVIASEVVASSPVTNLIGSADFKNGVYEFLGNPATFDDFIGPNDDWGTVTEGDITPGVGLEGTKFPAVLSTLAASFIALGVTPVFEFDTTVVSNAFSLEFLKTPDFDPEFYVTVGGTSTVTQPGGSVDLSGNNSLPPGSHVAAITILIDGRMSLSVDGDVAETVAWAGDGSTINTIGMAISSGVTLKKISFFTAQADVDLPALSVIPTEDWFTIYDATAGSFGSGDTDFGDENSRLMIDPSNLVVGSSGFTQIRVTFIGPITGGYTIDIENVAIGETAAVNSGDSFADKINYTSAPTVLTFDSGSPSKAIAMGADVVSDAVMLSAPFDGAHYLVIAINHGPISRMRGRSKTPMLLATKADTANDTVNTGDVSGDYNSSTTNRSFGISKIELKA